jgi:hypothetical protein
MVRVADRIWLAFVGLATACGEYYEPRWRLDEPQVLAVRIDVVQTGPHSEGLIPIPVDRIRVDPLPGDTVHIQPFIADATGLRDPADFDLHWLLCSSTTGPCLSLLRQPGSGASCDEGPPADSICRLGEGPSLRWTVPPLDPRVPFADQAVYRVVTVGTTGTRDPETCIEELGRDRYSDLDECLLAYAPMWLGPAAPLAVAARDAGVRLEPNFAQLAEFGGAFGIPNFHAELEQATLADTETERPFTIRPTMFRFDDSLYVAEDRELPSVRWYLAGGGDFADPSPLQLPTLVTGEVGEAFELVAVLGDSEGSQTVATFDIEVVAQ